MVATGGTVVVVTGPAGRAVTGGPCPDDDLGGLVIGAAGGLHYHWGTARCSGHHHRWPCHRHAGLNNDRLCSRRRGCAAMQAAALSRGRAGRPSRPFCTNNDRFLVVGVIRILFTRRRRWRHARLPHVDDLWYLRLHLGPNGHHGHRLAGHELLCWRLNDDWWVSRGPWWRRCNVCARCAGVPR